MQIGRIEYVIIGQPKMVLGQHAYCNLYDCVVFTVPITVQFCGRLLLGAAALVGRCFLRPVGQIFTGLASLVGLDQGSSRNLYSNGE